MLDKEGKYCAVSMGLTLIGIIIIAVFFTIHALWFALVETQISNEYLIKRVQELSRTCGKGVTHARQ
jgi:hypothetical protein